MNNSDHWAIGVPQFSLRYFKSQVTPRYEQIRGPSCRGWYGVVKGNLDRRRLVRIGWVNRPAASIPRRNFRSHVDVEWHSLIHDASGNDGCRPLQKRPCSAKQLRSEWPITPLILADQSYALILYVPSTTTRVEKMQASPSNLAHS